MKKYKILISNDDGPASPLLVPFIKAVKALPICSEVRIVVPAKERSWIAKALTRFDPLTVTPHTFGDLPGFTVSGSGALGGTPADCVSLGINNLYRDPPNLVLSGINMGNNAGLAFALSSGTLGAALEASLYRVPAIAFSAQIPADLFKAWNQGTPDHSRLDWQRLGQIAAHHTFSVLQNGALSQCKVLSINYPWSVSEETPCLLTSVKRAYFRPLFIKLSENVYRHSFQGFEELAATNPRNSSELPYDIDVLEQEQVSMTAFDHFMEEVRHQNLSERISQLQAGRLSSCEGGEVD